MTPNSAADGLVYGFASMGIKGLLRLKCALYTCERILGQYPQVNSDKTDNVDWKFWKQAYDYLKTSIDEVH